MLSCPYFFKKNVHSLKNILLSYHFFSNFLWKIPFCRSHIWSKKCHFCKTTLYYRPKKLNRMPYFSDLHEKICAHAHILLKTFILSKTQCSHVIFSNLQWKPPCCLAHIWSKNHQLYQNYTRLYYSPKKSIGCRFFPFSRNFIACTNSKIDSF